MSLFVLFGKNGEIDTENHLSMQSPTSKINAPLVEIDYYDCAMCIREYGYKRRKGVSIVISLTEAVQEHYNKWGKYGSYGDMISLSTLGDNKFQINFIGRLAYPKPGLAADLLPFVRDKRGQLFFIGIIRKDNPGKGCPAQIGGFRNVKGFHFASAAETIISEGKEESGLQVVVCNDVIMNDVKNIINLQDFRAKIIIGDIEKYTRVQLVGTYHTSDDEEVETTGYKRVYETTAYTFVIDVDEELSEEDLADKLKAGDDAQGIFVWNFTRRGGVPKLAFAHHDEILIDALKIIS